MHLIAPLKNLIKLAERCAATADSKSAMPALANILIEGKAPHAEGAPAMIRVAGTNLYTSIQGPFEATAVPKPGGICLPASGLVERLKAMPVGDVEIKATTKSGTSITIKSVLSKRSFMLHGLPIGEYPPLPALPVPTPPSIQIPALTLGNLIRQTRFAISTDETRSHVNSALFEVSEKTLRMVSTDGHRLCKADVKNTLGGQRAPVLIPLKAIALLARVMGEAETSKEQVLLDLWFEGSNIFVRVGNLQYTSKLVDAQFPPYEQVIPGRNTHLEARVPRALLLSLLRAVAVGSDKTKEITLTLKTGMLYATSKDLDSGEAADEMPIDYSGPNAVVKLNADYIEAALACLTSEEVAIAVAGELDPFVLRPVAPVDSDFVGVIMPMRGK